MFFVFPYTYICRVGSKVFLGWKSAGTWLLFFFYLALVLYILFIITIILQIYFSVLTSMSIYIYILSHQKMCFVAMLNLRFAMNLKKLMSKYGTVFHYLIMNLSNQERYDICNCNFHYLPDLR